MRQRIKIGGTWRALDMFMKVRGEWKPSNRVYIKVNGKWELGPHLHAYSYSKNNLTSHIATCSICGSSTTEKHSYLRTGGTSATCTTAGSKIFVCLRCSQSKTEPVAALGHNYAEEIIMQPDCEIDGTTKYTCKNCGDTYYDDFYPPALGHIMKKVYNNDGVLIGEECSRSNCNHTTGNADMYG